MKIEVKIAPIGTIKNSETIGVVARRTLSKARSEEAVLLWDRSLTVEGISPPSEIEPFCFIDDDHRTLVVTNIGISEAKPPYPLWRPPQSEESKAFSAMLELLEWDARRSQYAFDALYGD